MENALNEYLTIENLNLTDICKKYNFRRSDFLEFMHKNKYYAAAPGKKKSSVIGLKNASEEYYNSSEKVTFTKLAKKHKINSTLLKQYYLEYYPEKCWNFDNHVFDCIDTEEKAYWLGFIYADGYIGSSPIDSNIKGYTSYNFEIALQEEDYDHLEKLKSFLKFTGNIHNHGISAFRLRIINKHFWETLNNLGCTPRKSLTLKFPDKSIFKSEDLIRHFIRGYWDGDGSILLKREDYPQVSAIGTSEFISELISIINIENAHVYNNSKNNEITKKLMYNGKYAFQVANYLYDNCNVYLNRKYEKYKTYCRLQEESCRLSESNIGEDCDVNPEITEEIKKSSAS